MIIKELLYRKSDSLLKPKKQLHFVIKGSGFWWCTWITTKNVPKE